MRDKQPFNPIEIPNIALNLALEVLEQPVYDFPPSPKAVGAGVYLLYYRGGLSAYQPLHVANSGQLPKIPIYVGKAERSGKRKGFTFEHGFGSEIQKRIGDHVRSIRKVDNLKTTEFVCRYLSIEDAFIGLAESVLVSVFEPLWNTVLDGFGNNPTGGPRSPQGISRWDLFHPGRRRGAGDSSCSVVELENQIADHFSKSQPTSEERLSVIRRRIEKYGLA